MAYGQIRNANRGSFGGLRFFKTNKEINTQAIAMINRLETEIGRNKQKAEELCKKHDLTFDEVFEEEFQQRQTGTYNNGLQEATYVSKATAGIQPTRGAQSVLQQIQADMNEINRRVHKILALQNEIENFRRIANHITPSDGAIVIGTLGIGQQELTYDELEELGFK